MPGSDPTRHGGPPGRRVQPKQVGAIAAIALVIVFALLNTQEVTIHWIVTTTHTSLFVALLVAAALGGLGGYGLSYLQRRGRRS